MKEGNEYATCAKCRTEFERPEEGIPPDHSGFLCPVCRKRKLTIVGVVTFIPDIQLNKLPRYIMTA